MCIQKNIVVCAVFFFFTSFTINFFSLDTFHDFTIFYKITICEHKKLEDESNKKNKSIITKENNVASCRDIVINAS